MLLTNLLEENIKKFGEYPFLYCSDQIYSNLDVASFARQIAKGLRSMGIERGDRIFVCMPNCPEVLFSYQGILRAGAIVVPVMFLLHAKEMAYILEDSKAKVVITSSFALPKVQSAIQQSSSKPAVIAVDVATNEQVINLYDFMDRSRSEDYLMPEILQDNLAVILYTSGTTGDPKGVMLTHQNLYFSAESSAALNTEGRGTTLGVLPLAHVFGFTVSNISYILGNSIVVFAKFEPEEVFRAIERYRVRNFSTVPTMIHAMVMNQTSKSYDLSSLQSVTSGSAPLPVPLLETFREKFKAEVYEGYGLSEASPVVTAHRRGQPVKSGSVGKPLPGVQIQIVNSNGDTVPTGEVGELIVRGPNIMPGYYKNEAATESTLKNGWLFTGDMGMVDSDGYLYIVDRKKDLIIRGGFNVYPRDLEELLAAHNAVLETAVIGVPSERMGEEIIAFVVKRSDQEISEQELIQYCQDRLALFKTPRRIVFTDRLPRNGVGKILKQRLRELATDVELML